MKHEGTSALRTLSESHLQVRNPSEDVRGKKVFDKDGKHVGHVADLMVDESGTTVRFLRVAQGGFLGMGEKHHLIPVDAVTDIKDDGVHIDRTHDHVAGAPDYDPTLAAADHRAYWSSMYDYWGYAPFWSAGYLTPSFPLLPRRPEDPWQKHPRDEREHN